MDLSKKLDKFKQQQASCQSTLAKVAASRPPPKSSTITTSSSSSKKPQAPAPSSLAQPPPPQLKFSNDTERLQHINSIRKSAVGAQIKRVIDLLFETRQALTPAEINEACYVDINANKGVFESLKKNVKVNYDGHRFSYKSKHDLKDKHELLVLIRKAPEGVAVIDLKDAYPSVLDDLQELKASGDVWLLSNYDSQEDIVYPNDPKVKIKVDEDVKQLYREIELPKDMVDIEKDLQKNGMKPATNTAKRKAAMQVQGAQSKQKQKKKREFTKRTRLTNAHMPELFK
jgi:transcription initiation factor TFIIE subunit beta